MPQIKIQSSCAAGGDNGLIVEIDIQNRGAAPVAITRIFVWTGWDRKNRPRSGGGIQIAGKERLSADVKGPPLPFTVNGYHSQSWTVGGAHAQELVPGPSGRKVLLDVSLSTGQSLYQEMNLISPFDMRR